jgi:signal peptidase I
MAVITLTMEVPRRIRAFCMRMMMLGVLITSTAAFSTAFTTKLSRCRVSTKMFHQCKVSHHRYSPKKDVAVAIRASSTTTEPSPVQCNSQKEKFTVSFPPLVELQDIQRGDFVASKPFQLVCQDQEHDFRVLVYPRGGGHSSSYTARSKKQEQKGGPLQQVRDLLQNDDARKDRVGVYLQYLPNNSTDTVDASFNLRLKGRQTLGAPRFDVDWTAGMRFVSSELGNLWDGTANDFGAHMMSSYLLEDFLGGENSQETLDVEVTVKIHPVNNNNTIQSQKELSTTGTSPLSFAFRDIRETTDSPNSNNNVQHNPDNVRVGKIIVPVLLQLSQRPRMFQLGAYPGVEYRIMRILHPETGEDVFTSMPGADYELKPIYPLVPALERSWPIRVNERELPRIYTMTMYNTISALGSLFTAVTGLTTAFLISQLVSLFFIPSKSMDPTLRVGDVLLVEKVTPRVFKNFANNNNNIGDVILFHPNNKLQDIVKANGGRISDRDLFVKRIAAGPGDSVSVDSTGRVAVNGVATSGRRDLCDEEPLRLIQRYIQPMDNQEIANDQVFVMGDCSSVSVDSRVWGPLQKDDIVGKPLLRIWPLERWGTVPNLPSSPTSTTTSDDEPSAATKGMLVSQWTD